MAKISLISLLLITSLYIHSSAAITDPNDVVVLRDIYKSLNEPGQLVGWSSDGGDPCQDSWTGVSCQDSSIIAINLSGQELTGSLGGNLSNLINLKQFDFSNNSIRGEIPAILPPNAVHVDLSINQLVSNIWFLAKPMVYLEYLNVSHNSLSGPLDNVFMGFPNLKQMDLSYNQYSGDLPSSFEMLANLNGLFLQRNQFAGSIAVLSQLPLHDLYLQMNLFSGEVPKEIYNIPNLRLEANLFSAGNPGDPKNFTPSSPSNPPNPKTPTKASSVKLVALTISGAVLLFLSISACWFCGVFKECRLGKSPRETELSRRDKWP